MPLRLLDHPLAASLMTGLRDAEASTAEFRRRCANLTTLLVLEATRDLATRSVEVQTPIARTTGQTLAEPVVLVPVLRAGLGMVESALQLFPDAAVGYVGLVRDEETAIPSSYYCKLPALEGALTLCLDPMLATGGSASQALALLEEQGAGRVVLVCIVAAPEGIARIEADHPSTRIVCAAVDEGLDARKYIVPGLGDFGDRLSRTS